MPRTRITYRGDSSRSARAPQRDERELQVALSQVDDEIARDLLARFTPLVERIARRYRRRLATLFHVVTQSDLEAVGRVALLEAWLRYRDGDASRDNAGGGYATWARRIVAWRIRETVERAHSLEPPSVLRADSHNGVLRHKAAQGFSPAAECYASEVRLWLRFRIGSLSPRRQVIVAGILQGHTQAVLGRSLGVSEGLVSIEYTAALEELRGWARQDGIDGVSFDTVGF